MTHSLLSCEWRASIKPSAIHLIRIAAKAGRRPQRPKAPFEQLPEEALPNPVAGGFTALADAPVVQVRDLAEFELAAAAA